MSVKHVLFISELESKNGSEEETSGSEGDGSSGSGSGSEDDDDHSQTTQDTADTSSLADVTPEKRKRTQPLGTEVKRRKVVDENLLTIPLQEGYEYFWTTNMTR